MKAGASEVLMETVTIVCEHIQRVVRLSMMSATDPALRTEFAFVLPRGYVDEHGRTHREGVMRLATARDEIAPQVDPACARTRRT